MPAETHEGAPATASGPLAKIVFQPGGTQLTPESERTVDELVPMLRASDAPLCFFVLDDGVGSSAHSGRLGAKRVRELEKRLVAAGVGQGKFWMRSRFVERPADPPPGWSGSGTILVERCE